MSTQSWVSDEGAVAGLDRIQPFAPLDAATEAALRASIERFGVIVPVVKDQHGRILDGHHRDRIASELGVEYQERVVPVADENEAREVARTLNADRRHLTINQRREVVAALREDGHSLRAIGGALGVAPNTVRSDLAVQDCTPERTEGLDGKSYPATREAPEWKARKGLRKRPDKTAPFELTGPGSKMHAAAQSRRLIDGLSHISGMCQGLADLDYGMAAAALSGDELNTWARKAGELARALRAVRTHLLEATNVQAQ